MAVFYTVNSIAWAIVFGMEARRFGVLFADDSVLDDFDWLLHSCMVFFVMVDDCVKNLGR